MLLLESLPDARARLFLRPLVGLLLTRPLIARARGARGAADLLRLGMIFSARRSLYVGRLLAVVKLRCGVLTANEDVWVLLDVLDAVEHVAVPDQFRDVIGDLLLH